MAYEISCACGASKAKVGKLPRHRFYCHCTICQELYQKPFADVTIVRANAVDVTTPDTLTFKKYKAPPALDRGVCNHCKKPLVGFLSMPLMPKLAFVPAMNFAAGTKLPAATMHIYYKSRTSDCEDDLRKVAGAVASQLAVAGPALQAAFA